MRRLSLLLVLALTGCGPAAPPGTVFYASGADLQSINPLLTIHPLAKQVQRYALFTTLARYDSALAPQPYLAERWTWSADRRSLDLSLRRDVRWHDGAPTTGADVAFTLDAARDPATGYPRASDLACVTEVAAPDSFSVSVSFCRPQERFPDVLTDLAILPAHLLGTTTPHAPRSTHYTPRTTHHALRTSSFNDHPIGNGPFRFVSHQPGRRWVFAANPDFPRALGGPPPVARLVIVVVDEATTKLAGLVSGELDFAGILPMHASLVRRIPGLDALDYPIILTYGLVWNTRRPPFDDARLRRALTMAVDRAQLVRAYLYGFGEVADGPVPPSHPLAVSVPRVPFDRAGAAALLGSLGWRIGPDGTRAKGGERLAFTLSTVGSADNVLEQMIQADLAAVGVEVRIRQLELGAFLAAAQSASRDYDALVTGISGDLSLGYLGGLFDSRRLSGPLQYAQYRSAATDRALDAGDYGEVQRLVARDLPITFLYHARGVQGVRRRVRGVRMDLRGELATLARWRLEVAAR
ncbi:MAG: peptide ABC transporter substrate-binding protein [Gemmatimonadetes bacterium]|nr:peptide ABC transporter substrate-binding protein [Gemmatimonadota bacterium]